MVPVVIADALAGEPGKRHWRRIVRSRGARRAGQPAEVSWPPIQSVGSVSDDRAAGSQSREGGGAAAEPAPDDHDIRARSRRRASV